MNRRHSTDDIAPEYDFSEAERGRYSGRFYVDPETPAGTAVVLRRSLPEHQLEAGDVGELVGTDPGPLLIVRFSFGSEAGAVEIPLAPGDLRLMTEDEVLHARRTRAS